MYYSNDDLRHILNLHFVETYKQYIHAFTDLLRKWSKNIRRTSQNNKYFIATTVLPILAAMLAIGMDTNIEVIVVSLTTWEAHHSPKAKWGYQFLFYHDETKLMMDKKILSR